MIPLKLTVSPGSTRKLDSRVSVSCTQTRSRRLVPTQKPSSAATCCTGDPRACTGAPAYRESGGLPVNGRIARSWEVSVRSPVATGATALGQGIAQACAHLAVEQVASCIEGALPAAVPGRQGVEDRLAAVGRQVDAADGQEIVDAQLGPGPRELRGHRPRCRPELRRERRGVGPFHLVGDQGGAVPSGQARQSIGDRPCLLLLQRPLVGPVRLAEIDQAVQVALLGGAAPNMRDSDIAGQDHGERCQGVVVEPWPGLEEPGEGLLHEIIDDLWIPDTSGHHTSDQRGEREDVPLLGV
jgi:hypothetical protein